MAVQVNRFNRYLFIDEDFFKINMLTCYLLTGLGELVACFWKSCLLFALNTVWYTLCWFILNNVPLYWYVHIIYFEVVSRILQSFTETHI